MAYHEVNNAPGCGSFLLVIDGKPIVPVPAIETPQENDEDAWASDRRAAGDIVLVRRSGERGMAVVQANTNLLEVKGMDRRYFPRRFSQMMVTTPVEPSEFGSSWHVDTGYQDDPPYIHITGNLRDSGKPFAARVIYQPPPEQRQ